MFKLRNLLEKLATKEVSLMAGREGFKVGMFLAESGFFLYSRMPATVELSKVPVPVKYGLASMKKVAFGYSGFVFNRTFEVCPGPRTMISDSKGLT